MRSPTFSSCMPDVLKMCITISVLTLISVVRGIEWKYSVQLDNSFLMLWTPGINEITFEVQVRTPGYVGFGFTRDDGSEGVDMVIGWVDNNGQVHLQDRHIKGANREPQMDSSQDYHLQSGYENKTHTVLRFNRRYDTCDSRDLIISNDTLKVIWQYNVDEPPSAVGALPADGAIRGIRPLYLVQRDVPLKDISRKIPILQVWDLFNVQVRLPMDQDTLFQCRIFRSPKISRKHHIIRYEPIINSGSQDYLHHMILYECRGDEKLLETARLMNGSTCSPTDKLHAICNTIAVTWSLGSEGFNYPPQAGYALDPYGGPIFYMLETLYSNPNLDAFITDNSGLKLIYTDTLRQYDAGVISIGIDPNWRHIIPPGQPEVLSEGHCISKCTKSTIPDEGVNIFSVIMHTHGLGKKVRLRQIRQGRELPPIAADSSYEPSYQEYRSLQEPVKMHKGDHLIAECIYSSRTRQALTLGGFSAKEETCLASVLYYPRTDLSLCQSLPSLQTVLLSIGIEKLSGPYPLKIASPIHLKGMTLEERLISYDWQKNFQVFQDTTRSGTFKALCSNTKGNVFQEDILEAHYPRILRSYQDPEISCMKKPQRNKLSLLFNFDGEISKAVGPPEYDETNAIERGQLIRNKVFQSNEDSLTGFADRMRLTILLLLMSVSSNLLLIIIYR